MFTPIMIEVTMVGSMRVSVGSLKVCKFSRMPPPFMSICFLGAKYVVANLASPLECKIYHVEFNYVSSIRYEHAPFNNPSPTTAM